MAETYKIICENVSKIYDLNKSKKNKLFSFLTFNSFNKSIPFYALDNINFSVEPGTSVGIIGLNGSGKSTLSNILGGVVEPSTGKILSQSQPSLIAIGAGLNNQFTGVENIHFKCLMHGMTQKEISNKFDEIVAFSELGEFINQPLKSYSSGMRSRLGFAIAIHTNPDILIVDEALAVGDETFSNKCILKMKELQDNGKTIFFVSHSASQVKKMCNKALWIHYGKLVAYGDIVPVINKYNDFIKKYKSMSKEEQLEYKIKMFSSQKKLFRKKVLLKKEKPSFFSLVLIIILLFSYACIFKIQLGF
ncbi:ABC transporter ATP-binding protein [Staphylococcus saprophyticus]|nr:ABC transporter ATP-binding protein [Staphylococcus saprophyticus]MDW4013178.1 ABC transporter ATP-binding protein [Staphylococcus saprophyticus]